MDYVVLIDSNIIIGNGYKITSPSIKDFFKSNQLVVAEPTRQEVIRNYNKIQEYNEKNLSNAIRNATRFGIKNELITKAKVDYESQFNQELEKLKTIILTNEKASIDFIFNKSLLLEKPFKKNNKNSEVGGFRDALIWNLWLVFLEESHYKYNEIIIINQDKDFVKGNELEADLKSDLNSRDIPNDKVIVLNSLKSLAEIALNYAQHERTDETIDSETLKNIQTDIIDKSVLEGLEDAITTKIIEHFPEENDPEVNFIGRKHTVYNDTITGSKKDLYLYFTERFIVSTSYFISKSDYLVDLPNNICIW